MEKSEDLIRLHSHSSCANSAARNGCSPDGVGEVGFLCSRYAAGYSNKITYYIRAILSCLKMRIKANRKVAISIGLLPTN